MITRHVLAGFAAAALILAGCQNQPSQPTASTPAMHSGVSVGTLNPADANSRPSVSIAPAGADTSPATRPVEDPSLSTAALLAHTTATYAQSVTPPAKPKQPTDGADVVWADSKPASADPLQKPAGQPTPVRVEIASANDTVGPLTSAANSVPASLKESPTPRIVPESQDLPQESQPKPEPSTDVLAAKLTQQVRDYPRDIASQMDLQLLQFLRDEPVPSMDSLASLPAEDREILSAVMDGMSNFRNTVRADRNLLVSRKVQPLLDMADRLRAQADLTIPTVQLCKKVSGFGNYDPMDCSFDAGAEHPAILYCEIENFASTLDDKKMWETRLSEEAVLYTETGLKVWGDANPAFTDYSRNRRHDFYLVKKIALPANLTIGRYLLKVSIVDQQANRVAEATLPLQIIAQ